MPYTLLYKDRMGSKDIIGKAVTIKIKYAILIERYNLELNQLFNGFYRACNSIPSSHSHTYRVCYNAPHSLFSRGMSYKMQLLYLPKFF